MDDVTFHVEMGEKYQQRTGNIDQAFEEFFIARKAWDKNAPKPWYSIDGEETEEAQADFLKEHPEPGTEKNPFKASNGVKIYWTANTYDLFKIIIERKINSTVTPEDVAEFMGVAAGHLQYYADLLNGKFDMTDQQRKQARQILRTFAQEQIINFTIEDIEGGLDE